MAGAYLDDPQLYLMVLIQHNIMISTLFIEHIATDLVMYMFNVTCAQANCAYRWHNLTPIHHSTMCDYTLQHLVHTKGKPAYFVD